MEPSITLPQRLRQALAIGQERDVELKRADPRVMPEQLHSPAAVLIAITDRPEPGVILTRRADHLRTHAGQVAFPGGRVDNEDADVIAAALREAEEEIGLPRAHVDVIGITDPYKTYTGYDIIPVLAVIPPDIEFHPHLGEVESVFETPLSELLHPDAFSNKLIEYDGKSHHYYELCWQDYRIWGVTAAIIVNLAQRLGHEL